MDHRLGTACEVDGRDHVGCLTDRRVMNDRGIVVAESETEESGVAGGDGVDMRNTLARAVTESKHVTGGGRVVDDVRIDHRSVAGG